ncbi:GTPase-activating protein gyp7 [Peniophora sp. CONT]|nr:GTPase-activating protein gyp7 [Peniophora sp. CONT]
MVEIKQNPGPSQPSPPPGEDEAKYRLVYAKSKVYVNPTAYARDNIAGFVSIVKRDAFTSSYFLSWIPETLVNEKGPDEWEKFIRTEEKPILDDEDEDAVLIDMPTPRPESYAFSVPITSICSLIVHAPSLSSWYGSININLISGSTLPTLYFHDDESRSFSMPQPQPQPPTPSSSRADQPPSYPPPQLNSPQSSPGRHATSWGGEDLLSRLRTYAHLLRSTLDPTLYLVDPSKADIETHSTQLFSDDAVDAILARSSYSNSYSPVPAHRRPRPLSSTPGASPNPYSQHSSILHRSLPQYQNGQPPSQARTALLQSFANITRATKHAAQQILSHPLARPIVPHLPDPIQSLVNASGDLDWGSWVEKGGVGEFEAARVYLARWARIVAEEGERARRREAQALPSEAANPNEETSELGIFELLQSTANLPTPKTTRDPKHAIDLQTFEAWFDESGRPKISHDKLREEIFSHGISDYGATRRRIWPYLLGVYEWDVTEEERQKKWAEKMKLYHDTEAEWFGRPEVFDRPDVLEERHRIDVDCRRTDRNQPLFASVTASPSKSGGDPEKREHRRLASIAPSTNEIGAQSPSNEHIDRLGSVLLTYNFFEKNLGYVQGMSDLCAPIYVVMGSDEPLTFWCFVEVMNRMKQNFLRDQSGMRSQLSTLQQLIEMMDPELYRHLEKTDGLNLFFCFRWILISFKREFPFEDVLRLWEVLWTDRYSVHFVLFVALAVLESHRDVILRYLVEFDEILKYCNELSNTIELDSTLAQAEVLFLSFKQLVEDMDRKRSEISDSGDGLRLRRGTDGAEQRVSSIPELSSELRDLLVRERTSKLVEAA